MSDKKAGGVSVCGVLFIVFLVLKLAGVVSWSWWWIFSPLWIPALLVIAVLLIAVIISATK